MAGMAYSVAGSTEAAARLPEEGYKLVNTDEIPNICCYCSGGCGTMCSVRDGELINIEGDPDHPVNRGGLCSKGSAQFSVHTIFDDVTDEKRPNPNRQVDPMVRRPGSSEWEVLTWDEAIDEISRKIKDTRDASYIEKDENGVTVNRNEGIAELGAAMLDNEEAYLVQKLMRALGVVYIDHQARV